VPEEHRRLAAIMFTDMVGYSALAQADEAAALRVLDRHNRVLRPVFARYGGREIKTVGDAFLVEFESALEAVRCAIDLQRSLHDYNAASPEEWRIRIRVGIHVGDVVPSNGDVLGDAVNIASRIQPLADPDGISLTQQVYDQVQNKVAAAFVRLPARELKNIRTPVTVYRVVQPWIADGSGLAAGAATPGRHLAVLPLANISPDPGDAYFADGLTEELITALSQVPDLTVIARTSVMPYKAETKPIHQVGAELGVDTILEGSVRKAGNRLRITLQLVDVATQGHIWADSYNREIDDIFAVQTDVAGRTAEALRIELARRDVPAPPARPPPNPAAYDLYLRGLVAAAAPHHGTPEYHRALGEAIRYFEEATKLDPTFAEPFASWAHLLVVAAGDSLPMREVMPRARALAAEALRLDPDSSDAHVALANIAFQSDHDWQRAETEFRRAIALNPSNVSAHQFLALMLIALGRFDEAKELARRAIRLDPGGSHRMTLGLVDLSAGNFDEAIAAIEQDADPHASSPGHEVGWGMFYLAAGRRDEALRIADAPFDSPDGDTRFDHALLQALLGRPDEARAVAAEAERGAATSYTSATHLAMLYATIGEKSRALDLLERDFREGDAVLWLYYRGIWFESIRTEPRFLALLRQYGLPLPPGAPPPSK
jgi:adenylate cyclase